MRGKDRRIPRSLLATKRPYFKHGPMQGLASKVVPVIVICNHIQECTHTLNMHTSIPYTYTSHNTHIHDSKTKQTIKKKGDKAWGVVQWQTTCLACRRPCV